MLHENLFDRDFYNEIINTILLKIRMAYLTSEMCGFTTSNLWMFLTIPINDDNIINEAASFLTFVHEMLHYFRRCRANNIAESMRIHTPYKSLNKFKSNRNKKSINYKYNLFFKIHKCLQCSYLRC